MASEPYKLDPAPLRTSADSNCVTSITLGETPEVGSLRALLSRSPSRIIKTLLDARPRRRGRARAGLVTTDVRFGACSIACNVDDGRLSCILDASERVTICGVSAATRALPLAAVIVRLLSIMPGTSTKSSLYEAFLLKVTPRVAIAKPSLLTDA